MVERHPTASTRRLQRVVIAFVVLATLGLATIAQVRPAIYARDLAAVPSWVGPLLVAVLVAAEAVLIAGILRCWRWLFWLLLTAFGLSALRVPLLPLQLARLLPGGDPPWYAVLQAGIGIVQAAIAIWMVQLYRRSGVWACDQHPALAMESRVHNADAGTAGGDGDAREEGEGTWRT